MNTIWRKVWRDLWGNKARTVLVTLSIAVGVLAVGWNTGTFIMLLHDMDADYLSANPHSAIIYSAPFGNDLVTMAQRVPGVAQAEGRSGLTARITGNQNNRFPIQITAIPSVAQMGIDRIRPTEENSTLVLTDREIFIERTGLSLVPARQGDIVKIELPDRRVRELRVAAIVHDVTVFSTALSGQINAYVTPDTLEWLGGIRDYTQMYITVAERADDEAHVKAVASQIADKLERSGREVFMTFVYEPGHHPTKNISQSVAILLGGLGILAVFLSTFLVINTVTALLSQHIRQVGVMKSIGARTTQIVAMYIVLILGFGALSLLIAVPLSALGAFGMVSFLGEFLNFKPAGFRIPPEALGVQVGVALVVPVVGALVPVLNGARITIREAITSYGLGTGEFGQSLIDRLLGTIHRLPRPILISLRNTFRRKGRLALTLSTLTLGGAIFIAVFNLRASFVVAINDILGYFLSDVNIELTRSHRIQKIEPIVASLPGVDRVEGWGIRGAQVLSDDKSTGVDILIWAPPAGSTLIEPVITSGRWLLPEDENAIVVGNHLLQKRPDIQVGDEIVTKIEGKEYTWQVVGFFLMGGNVEPPFVYANYEYLVKALKEVGRASSFRVVLDSQGAEAQARVAKTLEERFTQAGIQLSQIATGSEQRAQQQISIDVLIATLMVMAMLIALVGGIGLTGTMSMNVLDRTREIGVMRAIGASDSIIVWMVVVEGMVIGVISWILGALLAVPITLFLGYAVGVAFIQVPLDFIFSLDGLLIWLAGVLVISAVASVLPARNAARLTIREVLAYE